MFRDMVDDIMGLLENLQLFGNSSHVLMAKRTADEESWSSYWLMMKILMNQMLKMGIQYQCRVHSCN
jgi:hypothetical protein